MSRDHSNASLQAMLPLVAKATVVAAGAAYVLYKFLWTDDEPEVADDNSDEPHWSEIESQRSKNRPLHPKPEFPTDESSKTTTTANDDPTYDEDGFEVQPMFPQTPQKTSRKSLSTHSLSEKSIDDIMAWFDAMIVDENLGEDVEFIPLQLCARSLSQHPTILKLLFDTTQGVDNEDEIMKVLQTIQTTQSNHVTRQELLSFLKTRTVNSTPQVPTSARKSFLSRLSLSPFNFRRFIYNVD